MVYKTFIIDLLLEPMKEFTTLKFMIGTLLLLLTLECFERAVYYDVIMDLKLVSCSV